MPAWNFKLLNSFSSKNYIENAWKIELQNFNQSFQQNQQVKPFDILTHNKIRCPLFRFYNDILLIFIIIIITLLLYYYSDTFLRTNNSIVSNNPNITQIFTYKTGLPGTINNSLRLTRSFSKLLVTQKEHSQKALKWHIITIIFKVKTFSQ